MKNKLKTMGLIAWYTFSASLWAQDIYLIKAGKLFDSEKGTFLQNQDILVEANIIRAVGTGLPVSKNTKIIDLSRYTVLPGLIDSHTHLLYLEPFDGDLTLENVKLMILEGDALRVLRASKRARTFLDAGITAVKDLGNSGQFLDVALKKAIQEGTVQGPRMFVSGPILSSVGGQLPGITKTFEQLIANEYRIVRDIEDGMYAVRENINYGADLIKICADNTPNNTTLSVDQMKAIVQTAHRYNKKVTAHATSAKAIQDALQAGVDGIEHGYRLTDSLAALMAAQGTYLVPTDFCSEFIRKYSAQMDTNVFLQVRNRLVSAFSHGVKIVSGSDGYIDFGIPQGDAAKKILVAYYESGMKPTAILQSCTHTAAEFMGMSNKLGVIKKDAFADIIAVEGDLEREFVKTIFQVSFVMTNGKIYKNTVK